MKTNQYPTARGLIDLVSTLESPEPPNPNLTGRIDIWWGNGEKELIWVRAGGDMIGTGGTMQARMARTIQDTWARLHASRSAWMEAGVK